MKQFQYNRGSDAEAVRSASLLWSGASPLPLTPRSNLRAFVGLVKPLEDSGIDKPPEPRGMLCLSG